MSLKRKPPTGDVRRVRSNGQNIRGVITNKAGRMYSIPNTLCPKVANWSIDLLPNKDLPKNGD